MPHRKVLKNRKLNKEAGSGGLTREVDRVESRQQVGCTSPPKPGTVTELVEHESRMREIVGLNPWSSQTSVL